MLKKCPQCGSVYTDQTLNFCLSDGTSLIVVEEEGKKTLELSQKQAEETLAFRATTDENIPETETKPAFKKPEPSQPVVKQGVSSFWLFATFGLLGVLIIGGGIFLGIYFGSGFFETNSNTGENSNLMFSENNERPAGNSNLTSNKTTPSPSPTQKPQTYRVVGVAGNDVLYIRPSAGNLKVKVGSIPPNGKGIIVRGKGKKVGKSIWLPIIYKGKKGWVNSRYLAKE